MNEEKVSEQIIEYRKKICQNCDAFATDRPDWCDDDSSCAHCKWESNTNDCPRSMW